MAAISKHNYRMYAVSMYYAYLIRKDETETLDTLIADVSEMLEVTVGEFTKKLLEDTIANQEKIIGIIGQLSKTRTVERIPVLNRAIISLAMGEIYSDRFDTHTDIVISEAVLLTKEFCGESDCKFVNGLLGNFARTILNQPEEAQQ